MYTILAYNAVENMISVFYTQARNKTESLIILNAR